MWACMMRNQFLTTSDTAQPLMRKYVLFLLQAVVFIIFMVLIQMMIH